MTCACGSMFIRRRTSMAVKCPKCRLAAKGIIVKIIQCAKCSRPLKVKSLKQKYCDGCKIEVKREQSRLSTQRQHDAVRKRRRNLTTQYKFDSLYT